MAVTFNGVTKRITVSGLSDFTTVNVESDIYSAWKTWVRTSDNAKYKQALRPVGGDPIGGTQTVPPYFFLMYNWKVEVSGIQNLTFNTNLYCDEATNLTTNPFLITNNGSVISKTSDAPVNTIQVSSISQVMEYEGRVYLDAESGTNSTVYPAGTRAQPCKTLTEAMTIGDRMNINSVMIAGEIPLDQDVSGWEFTSWKNGKIDLNNQTCMATRFRECKLYGIQHVDSVALVYDCRIEDITGIQGVYERCKFMPTVDITIGTGDVNLYDCKGQVGGDFVTFDFTAGGSLYAKDFTGNISVKNSTSMGVEAQMSFLAGMCQVESSVTGGVFVPTGAVRVINQATPPAVVVETGALATPSTVRDELDDVGEKVTDIHQSHFNKRSWDQSGNTITIYDDDGVTPLHVFDTNSDMSEITPQ